jgi:hypothetical protein
MTETTAVAVIIVLLLLAEWKYAFRSLRFGTVMLSLLILFFASPSYTTAARRASVAPPDERVTHRLGSKVSDYESGVLTMMRELDEAVEARATMRLLALGALTWLACSPSFGRARRREHSSRP